jgi:hypothetical protein
MLRQAIQASWRVDRTRQCDTVRRETAAARDHPANSSAEPPSPSLLHHLRKDDAD